MRGPWDISGRPIVIAHRGAPALSAENTADGFAKAIEAGADAIETDVRQTRDGHLVCVHDDNLQRVAGHAAQIAALSLDELRAVLPSAMTLRAALAASGSAGLLLDIKIRDAAIAGPLTDLVGVADRERVLFGARSLDVVRALRSRAPEARVLAFSDTPDRSTEWTQAGAKWVRFWQADLTSDRVTEARSLGLRIACMVGDWRSENVRPVGIESVGVIDEVGLGSIRAQDPDAILLDDPRLLVRR